MRPLGGSARARLRAIARKGRAPAPPEPTPFERLRGLTRLASSPGLPTYLLDTADVHMSPTIYASGGYEEDVMAWSLDYLGHPQRDRVVLEVGANIGTTTIPLLTRFGASHVEAWEPEPHNHRLLRCNVILNELEADTTLHATAISDRRGIATMELCAWNLGDHRVRLGTATASDRWDEASWPTVEVPVDRLDDAVESDPGRVGLIWVDSQGHEAHVLAGAPGLLGKGLPWHVEYWPYGLRRVGGLQRLHEAIALSFSEVVDVRQSLADDRPAVCGPARLDEVAARVGEEYTDLLLIP